MNPVSALETRLLTRLRSNPDLKARLRQVVQAIGYDTTDWMRVVMYRECFAFIRSLGPERLDAMEISAGPQWRAALDFGSHVSMDYPQYDICRDVMDRQFDLIIADQVFEHLSAPWQAAQNVHAMLRPGGYAVISTPFLVRVHPSPIDCSRWTETGLSHLLQQGGFEAERIKTAAWGNRACLKANLTHWRKRGFFGSLKNEPLYPVMVWAIAQKAPER